MVSFVYSSSGSSKITKDKETSKDSKSNVTTEHASNSNKSVKEKSSSVKIYVSGITDETKASDLHDLFSKHSTVTDAKIIRFSKIPNQCFGLITIENDQQYSKCFQNINKTTFKGNTIMLSRVSLVVGYR